VCAFRIVAELKANMQRRKALMQSLTDSCQPRGRLVWIVLLVATGVSNASGDTWLAVTPEGTLAAAAEAMPQGPQAVVDGRSDSGLAMTVDVVGVELGLETTEAGEFVRVGWPESPLAGEPGAPALHHAAGRDGCHGGPSGPARGD
jgi:hypothetical protein